MSSLHYLQKYELKLKRDIFCLWLHICATVAKSTACYLNQRNVHPRIKKDKTSTYDEKKKAMLLRLNNLI